MRRVRERRESGNNQLGRGCLKSVFYVAVILGISLVLSAMIITVANDVFAFVKPYAEHTIQITGDTRLSDVASELKKNDIIELKLVFRMFATFTGSAKDYEPGTYTVSSDMDYRQILNTMKKRAQQKDETTVTIPEGMEMRTIFKTLEDKGVCSYSELMAAAKDADFEYTFIAGKPKEENRLEGYLFPDTYIFYKEDDPVRVISKFLKNFSRKYGTDIKAKAVNMGMTVDQVLTVAAMIEKEAKLDEERAIIASVIYNRLENKNFKHLQIDATVQYALGVHKESLSSEDMKVDSPYNTYVVEGLPKGPICSPGLESITAAVNPEDTRYYYYVARSDGSHYFAQTLAQHNANIAKVKRENAQ